MTTHAYGSEEKVIIMRRQHSELWRDKDDAYWFARLVEEVGELGGSLVGNHEGPTEHELAQISAICMNWLMKLHREKMGKKAEANTEHD